MNKNTGKIAQKHGFEAKIVEKKRRAKRGLSKKSPSKLKKKKEGAHTKKNGRQKSGRIWAPSFLLNLVKIVSLVVASSSHVQTQWGRRVIHPYHTPLSSSAIVREGYGRGKRQ